MLTGKQIGDIVLFFGCRKKSEDYIYEDELTSYEKDGTIADLHVAFSRDQVRQKLSFLLLSLSVAILLFLGKSMVKWLSKQVYFAFATVLQNEVKSDVAYPCIVTTTFLTVP